MPALEELSHKLKEENKNLIGIGADSGKNADALDTARWILSEKQVTYQNLIPDVESEFYTSFIEKLAGYPVSYLVDREGNIVGAPIVGNVESQMDTILKRMDQIKQANG